MKKPLKCCICGDKIQGYPNNPWPIMLDGVCCDACDILVVLPARIRRLKGADKNVNENRTH